MRAFWTTIVVGLAGVFLIVGWGTNAGQWGPRTAARLERPLSRDEIWVPPPGPIDERGLRLRQLASRTAPPFLVVLGGSRARTASLKLARPEEAFLNLSVGNASVQDLVATWEALKAYHLAPARLVIFLDPQILRTPVDEDSALYPFWLSFGAGPMVQHRPRESHARPTTSWLTQARRFRMLISWDGVSACVRSLRRRFGSRPRAAIIRGGPIPPGCAAYYFDGSVRYGPHDRSVTLSPLDVLKYYEGSPDKLGYLHFEGNAEQGRLLRQWMNDMIRHGSQVAVILPPYHPAVYRRLMRSHGLDVDRFNAWIGETVRIPGVSVCGADDPSLSSCQAADFQDAVHPFEDCLNRVVRRCLGNAGGHGP